MINSDQEIFELLMLKIEQKNLLKNIEKRRKKLQFIKYEAQIDKDMNCLIDQEMFAKNKKLRFLKYDKDMNNSEQEKLQEIITKYGKEMNCIRDQENLQKMIDSNNKRRLEIQIFKYENKYDCNNSIEEKKIMREIFKEEKVGEVLKPIAKALGIKSLSWMNKEEIINSILELESNKERKELQKLSVKNLKPIAKSLGIKLNTLLTKDLLMDSIIEFEYTEALIIIKKYYHNLISNSKEQSKRIEICSDYHKIVEIYLEIDFNIYHNNADRIIKKQCRKCGGMSFILSNEIECYDTCVKCGCIIEKTFSLIR